MNPRRILLAVSLISIGALGGAALSWAGGSTTDKSTPIDACVDTNGDIRIISGLLTCLGNEVSLAWNLTGPTGSQGPAGPAGPRGLRGETGRVPDLPTRTIAMSSIGNNQIFEGRDADSQYVGLPRGQWSVTAKTTLHNGHRGSDDTYISCRIIQRFPSGSSMPSRYFDYSEVFVEDGHRATVVNQTVINTGEASSIAMYCHNYASDTITMTHTAIEGNRVG